MSFTSFDLHPDLLRGLDQMGFAVPTPIQKDAIPPAIEGRDVLACAMTGSGKTAAFILPILQRLLGKPRGVTRALVITPTRELAAQIDEHRRDLARFTRVGGAAVYGGVGMGPQETAFRRGADIIVATPGRLLDHFQYPYARLQGIEVLVLDEADRMLDMGFLPDVRRVLKQLPARRQTLLFSATLPPPIVALAREMLRNPVAINVERPAGAGHRHQPRGVSGAVGPQVGALAQVARRARRAERARVHAHEASLQPAGRLPRATRRDASIASTVTGARLSAPRPWPPSRTGRSVSSSRRTSPRAGSTSPR